MKKISLFLALIMVVMCVSSLAVSASFDGMKEQEYYCLPKVNSDNPAIKIDGTLDFDNGEWNGALHYVQDYTVSDENERLYDWTIWSPDVWGAGTFNAVAPEDLPENWQPVINHYLLWDGEGIYIATQVKTKLQPEVTNASRNEAFLNYYGLGTTDSYEFGLPANVQHMILPTDDPAAYVATEGKWVYCYATDDHTESWSEDYTLFSSLSENEIASSLDAVGYQSQPDADGFVTNTYEMFVPWAFLNLDNYEEADTTMFDFYGDEGVVIQVGMITRLRNTPDAADAADLPYIQFTDSKGWRNYNYYVLSPKTAAYTGEISFWEADVNNQTVAGQEDAGYAAYVAAAAEAAAAAPAVEEAPVEEAPVEEAAPVEEVVVEEAAPVEEAAEEAPAAEEVVVEEAEVVEEAPAAVEEAPEAEEAAPQTFDAAILAAVAAVVSLAGYAVSKKH